MSETTTRTIGLAGATGIGVGAIVGGGILALAGVAFAEAGPSAILAFALNGVIAIVTALSFAELSGRFPRSGGTYTFARKVLSVEAAFAVGWVVWFASIVAAVLYAAGFAAFAGPVVRDIWIAVGDLAPEAVESDAFLIWLGGRTAQLVLAMAATLFYAVSLARRSGGGGAVMNIAKVAVFLVLIVGGLWALGRSPAGTITQAFDPFFSSGGKGLLQAMGFSFIALQGFDLIAAVAGEVKKPARTIPRAMLLSLGIALTIYLPLLIVVATVGVEPGQSIGELSAADPEAVIAIAAGRFLGPVGYWLVMVAAILAMLSALQANLFAASRVAQAMAEDHTLPSMLERTGSRGTPANAVIATALIVGVVLLAVPDVASAGAAASLIFLATFALAQGICLLARRRAGPSVDGFRVPGAPLTPMLGAAVCVGLAGFQGVAVPAAGMIAALWLGLGGILFLTLFAPRARVRDAASEASDPQLQRLRGRRPLVLVPVVNPAHASPMVEVANALAAPGAGRVLLLNVVTRIGDDDDEPGRARWSLAEGQTVLREAMLTSLSSDRAPEALVTVAEEVWPEIERVARVHDCESLLLGLSDLDAHERGSPLEALLGRVECDTVVLRAPNEWSLVSARRILVAVGGGGHHDILRARLIASLRRRGDRTVTYLRVVRPNESADRVASIQRGLERIARDEADGRAEVELPVGDDPIDVIVEHAAQHDLIILGLQRHGRRRKLFGDLSTEIARRTPCAILMIGRRG